MAGNELKIGEKLPVSKNDAWLESHKIAHHKKRAFLLCFAELGMVTGAAKAAGISRRTHYNWLEKEDPDGKLSAQAVSYKAAFEEAREIAEENLLSEARRRAVEGVEEPVYYQGKICGMKKRYSDSLLIFLLKALKPEKYRDHHAAKAPEKTYDELLADSWSPEERAVMGTPRLHITSQLP